MTTADTSNNVAFDKTTKSDLRSRPDPRILRCHNCDTPRKQTPAAAARHNAPRHAAQRETAPATWTTIWGTTDNQPGTQSHE